jgi:hypothetical protein
MTAGSSIQSGCYAKLFGSSRSMILG